MKYICVTCKHEKEDHLFEIYEDSDGNKHRRHSCRECRNAALKARYHENNPKAKYYPPKQGTYDERRTKKYINTSVHYNYDDPMLKYLRLPLCAK